MNGSWELLPGHSQTFAIHAALVWPGKILYFGGDEYDTVNLSRKDFNHASVFDTTTYEVTSIHAPLTDVFCCGQAKLADGRVLVAGGVADWSPKGLKETWIFDPTENDDGATGAWTKVASMLPTPPLFLSAGRWYPTLLTLPDGRVLAACGKDSASQENRQLEAFSPYPTPGGAWTPLDASNVVPEGAPAYPRLYVLPSGRLFCSSGMTAAPGTINTQSGVAIDVVPGPGQYAARGANAIDNWRRSGVLLPLVPDSQGAYGAAKVLICDDVKAYTIDLSNGATGAQWAETGPRAIPTMRLHSEALLLPTGEVFLCCGVRPIGTSGNYECVMTPELYDPVSNTWSTLPDANVGRGYHSVSILMPNGAVWTAGSSLGLTAPDGGPSDPPTYRKELRMEVFTPDYVTDPNRPVLSRAPGEFLLGDTFLVKTPNAASITKARILRTGSTTHAFNSDQRCVELRVTVVDPTTLRVTAPLDAAVAPPGEYLLFLIDAQNRPSVGKLILCIAERAITVASSKLWRRNRLGAGSGPDWQEGGTASNVTAMAVHQGGLYVTSNNHLWRRGRMGPATGNDWTESGEAYGVIAMASHLGDLYVVATDSKLWRRGALGPGSGNAWTLIGDAFNVQAMASHQGKLIVASGGKLWRRNKLDPNTGNDWIEDGAIVAAGVPVPNITGMASAGGHLYALMTDNLYRRENIDPTTTGESWSDPVWTDMGSGAGGSQLAFYSTLWG